MMEAAQELLAQALDSPAGAPVLEYLLERGYSREELAGMEVGAYTGPDGLKSELEQAGYSLPDSHNLPTGGLPTAPHAAGRRHLQPQPAAHVVDQAFEVLGREEVQLEVFRHNPRAIAAYKKVGFLRTGAHTEYIPPNGDPLHVVEMAIQRPTDRHLDSDER